MWISSVHKLSREEIELFIFSQLYFLTAMFNCWGRLFGSWPKQYQIIPWLSYFGEGVELMKIEILTNGETKKFLILFQSELYSDEFQLKFKLKSVETRWARVRRGRMGEGRRRGRWEERRGGKIFLCKFEFNLKVPWDFVPWERPPRCFKIIKQIVKTFRFPWNNTVVNIQLKKFSLNFIRN